MRRVNNRVEIEHVVGQIYFSSLLRLGDDEDHLGNQDSDEESIGSETDADDLRIQLVKAHPARGREGRQSVAHGNETLATKNGGLDLALEGAVERNDGALIGA